MFMHKKKNMEFMFQKSMTRGEESSSPHTLMAMEVQHADHALQHTLQHTLECVAVCVAVRAKTNAPRHTD